MQYKNIRVVQLLPTSLDYGDQSEYGGEDDGKSLLRVKWAAEYVYVYTRV